MAEEPQKDLKQQLNHQHQEKNRIKTIPDANSGLRRLYIATLICLFFFLGQGIAGYLSNSIAIISDAAHMLSDFVAYLISITSICLVKKPASTDFTYGYHRAEILGAVINIALIWGLTIWLVYQAVQRISQPTEIDGLIMLITALVGLVCNITIACVLREKTCMCGVSKDSMVERDPKTHSQSHPSSAMAENSLRNPKIKACSGEDVFRQVDRQQNVNLKAAFLHVLGDFLLSVGITIAAILILINPQWKIADPMCTFLFSAIILITTGPIMKECLVVLMEGTPLGVNIKQLGDDLAGVRNIQVEEIIEIHDLHVWSLSIGKSAVSCHLTSSNPSRALRKATRICREKYGITHTTLQIEDVNGTISFDCYNELHK